MEDVRVKGHSDLVRDPVTNAIINTNKSKYEEYISRRNIKKSENQKVQDSSGRWLLFSCFITQIVDY